jgi:hypothetical protein
MTVTCQYAEQGVSVVDRLASFAHANAVVVPRQEATMYEEKMAGRIMGFRYRLRHIDWLPPGNAAFVLLVLGVIVIVAGYGNQHPEGLDLKTVITDFYTNVGTELLSIAVTVLVIDALGARREASAERRRLVREMGSFDNGIALRAIREIRAHGYHADGSLHHADLMRANLQGAELWSADLRGASFHHANLAGADLLGADLRRSVLWRANLRGTHLDEADLREANLIWSDLREARVTRDQLAMADSLRGAVLPDGSRYDGRFRLKGDISQAKMDGIDTDDPGAMAKWYAVPYNEFVRSLDLRKDRPELTDWGHC